MIEWNTFLQIDKFYFFSLSEKFIDKQSSYNVFFFKKK